jgi:hypothetical protein
MRLKLERGLGFFFSKKLKQTITHPLSMFSALVLCFASDAQRTFVTLQFVHLMTPRLLNLVNE